MSPTEFVCKSCCTKDPSRCAWPHLTKPPSACVVQSPRQPLDANFRSLAADGVSAPCALKAAIGEMEAAAQAEEAGGRKDDDGKPPISLIPRAATLAEAEVLAYGARKYAAHNWRKGMRWTRLGDGAMRHLLAWLDGEDTDPESGLHHLAHVRASAGFLLDYAKTGAGEDDRYKAPV